MKYLLLLLSFNLYANEPQFVVNDKVFYRPNFDDPIANFYKLQDKVGTVYHLYKDDRPEATCQFKYYINYSDYKDIPVILTCENNLESAK